MEGYMGKLDNKVGVITSNNLAYICPLVTTKTFGRPLKPLISGLLIENQ